MDPNAQTELSQWKWESPGEIHDRENQIDTEWSNLSAASAKKLVCPRFAFSNVLTRLSALQAKLQDDLAREQFAEKTRLLNQEHVARHGKLKEYIATSVAYLAIVEKITSIRCRMWLTLRG